MRPRWDPKSVKRDGKYLIWSLVRRVGASTGDATPTFRSAISSSRDLRLTVESVTYPYRG